MLRLKNVYQIQRKNVPSAVPEFYFLPEIQRKWIW